VRTRRAAANPASRALSRCRDAAEIINLAASVYTRWLIDRARPPALDKSPEVFYPLM
jgi:hypothetical protein